EAMKMEVPVPAPSAGEVAQVHVAVGEQIPSGASLASLKGN
ncbi:MAG: biotin/lipoyl-containing protein, partial [Candidatus Latescibacterota bacterium]|nr:biotin/lipoyl-containing protein [Candidatus Latescibacterota bacterium]